MITTHRRLQPPELPSALKIFIIGTGRSGTHWLGNILDSHPDIHVTIEKEPVFSWVTEMALDPRKKPLLMPGLIRAYQTGHETVAPKHYADKSHPNIWHAEDLAAALPDAAFIGIRRNPYATVASMLKHAGVLQWQERWREFPVPNKFLGITAENREAYDRMPVVARCALRWRSHANRLNDLCKILGERLLIMEYEAMVERIGTQLTKLNNFLRLANPISAPEVKAESKNKWQLALSPEAKRQISYITETDLNGDART